MPVVAPFAAIERGINRVIFDRLANAVARFKAAGGAVAECAVIFDEPFNAPFEGALDDASPQCRAPAHLMGHLQRDDELEIDGRHWQISRAEPDGQGAVLFRLYPKS